MSKEKPLEIGARRRCDYDGKLYTVKSEIHRFCSDKCRQSFHRFGSPFLKLRAKIVDEVEAAGEAIECRMYSVLDPAGQNRYRRLYPARARRFDSQLAEIQQAAS